MMLSEMALGRGSSVSELMSVNPSTLTRSQRRLVMVGGVDKQTIGGCCFSSNVSPQIVLARFRKHVSRQVPDSTQ